MGARLRDRDRGLKRRLEGFRELKGLHAKVGIQGAKAEETHEGTSITMAELAAIHEFGAPKAGVPARSFLRSTFDADPKKWEDEMRTQMRRVVKSGANPQQALTIVAEKLRTAVVDHITEGIPPPLKPSTIARKGGETTPLLDTGALRGSITAVVTKDSA